MNKNQPHPPHPTTQSTDSDADFFESDTSKPSPTEHSQPAVEPVVSEQPETEYSQIISDFENYQRSIFQKELSIHTIDALEINFKNKCSEKKAKLFSNVHKKICDIIESELNMSFDDYINNLENDKNSGQKKKTSSPKKLKRPPRYHNPENHKETWNGLGRAPKWYEPAKTKYGEKELLIQQDGDASESPKNQDQDQT